MYCEKCNEQCLSCACEDMDERLRSLLNTPAAPAAAANLIARARFKEHLSEGPDEHHQPITNRRR